MFVLDDVLLFPVRGILFVFQEIYASVQEEFADESLALHAELSQLYAMLETGKITQGEFEAREKDLLDRLEKIDSLGTGIEVQAEEDQAFEDDKEPAGIALAKPKQSAA